MLLFSRNGSKDEIVESNVKTPSADQNLDTNETKEQVEAKSEVEENDTEQHVTKNYQFDDSMIGK